MSAKLVRIALAGLAVGVSGAAALGQWSSDPMNTLRVADASGDQVQPKLAPTSDGGVYVSWYDSIGRGYDVRLQKLDAQGHELWPHNGILVADRGVSSTVDYGLIADAGGNAVLVYNDDQVVPGTQQLVAQKVDASGNLLWGAHGVILSDTASSWTAPAHICQTTDGSYVAGWSGTSAVVMQKLDSSGNPVWSPRPTFNEILTPPSTLHYMLFSDIQAGDNGSFIVLWVRGRTNSFMSSKSLYAQKFDGNAGPLWTGSGTSTGAGSPVVVFDAGTTSGIQIGTFPTFLPDGNGGGVFGWYDIGGARNAYIQHVQHDGTLKFPAPIPNTGPGYPPTNIRTGAGLAYNTSTGEYYLASVETDGSTQSHYGVIAQKFDSSGNRLWGDTGATILASSTASQPSFVQSQAFGDGCMVFFMDTRSANTRVIDSARVNGDGTIAWHNLVNSDSSTDKSRLTSALDRNGFAIVAFGWGSSESDIGVQNVNGDGSLGNQAPPCYANCDGSTSTPVLNVNDFICFQNRFAAGDSYANCDGSTNIPVLNVNDFVCFQGRFAAGCR